MLSNKKLVEIERQNRATPSSESSVIEALLQHIKDVHAQTHLRYRVAYEIFRMNPGGLYRNRTTLGFAWSQKEAETLIAELREKRVTPGNPKITRIHVIKIDGKWYNILVTPRGDDVGLFITGNAQAAERSTLDPEFKEIHYVAE